MFVTSKRTRSGFGMNGPMRRAISGQSMENNGESGKQRMGELSISPGCTIEDVTATTGLIAFQGPGTPQIIDQISEAIELIKTNPSSRRMLVSAWNVGELDEMALMPCHAFFQFYVADGKLSCQLYQRSADVFLGVPFNIASYSLLTHMMAQVCGLGVGDFIHTIGDAHLYLNHLEQAKEQVSRKPMGLPTLKLDSSIMDIDDFTGEHIEVEGYEHHPHIAAPISM